MAKKKNTYENIVLSDTVSSSVWQEYLSFPFSDLSAFLATFVFSLHSIFVKYAVFFVLVFAVTSLFFAFWANWLFLLVALSGSLLFSLLAFFNAKFDNVKKDFEENGVF